RPYRNEDRNERHHRHRYAEGTNRPAAPPYVTPCRQTAQLLPFVSALPSTWPSSRDRWNEVPRLSATPSNFWHRARVGRAALSPKDGRRPNGKGSGHAAGETFFRRRPHV